MYLKSGSRSQRVARTGNQAFYEEILLYDVKVDVENGKKMMWVCFLEGVTSEIQPERSTLSPTEVKETLNYMLREKRNTWDFLLAGWLRIEPDRLNRTSLNRNRSEPELV